MERKHEAWRGQGLVHSSSSHQGKELWRAASSVSRCRSKMVEDEDLTVSLHFSNLCLFSLSPWTCLDLGIPPGLLHPLSSPEQIAPQSCKSSHCPQAPFWLHGLSGGRLHVGCGDVLLAISIGGLVPGIGPDGQGMSTQA